MVKKLPELTPELKWRKLDSFIIQGNIEQNRFAPWQIAGTERFLGAAPKKLKRLLDLPPYSKVAMFHRAKANSLNLGVDKSKTIM
ncbi:MAG: hypothetical protein FWC00_02795 [Firmicutes bacterium]|nr:hypothetical protein [Bacillota bacterium]